MKILAIDSSSNVATVAVIEEDTVLVQYSVNHKKTHSQTLLPMIEDILRMSEIGIENIDAIAVSAGPGSFTGLRIGSATAKGLALVKNLPIIEIPTIDGLAYNLKGCDKYICPMMDARRNQVYTGIYHFSKGQFINDMPVCQMDVDELINHINSKGMEIVFLGDGVKVYKDKLVDKLTVYHEFAAPHMSMQNAASVGTLAVEYYNAGKYVSAEEHQPDYLRKSQAERELEEKLAKND